MNDSNPYRSPLAETGPSGVRLSVQHSLATGFVIDAAGVIVCVLWMASAPWLRLFLPFAAGHAVAAALIVFRSRGRAYPFSAGDHFFLRYGALIMSASTAMIRAIY